MKFVVTVMLLFMSLIVSGQILKVNKRSIVVDTGNYWSGNIDFKLNLNNRSATPEENITFIGLNAKADVSYASTNHAYILVNNINYFTSGVGPFVSTGNSHFRINWLRKKKVSFENFWQLQYDRGRNLQRRALSGGGVKINFFQEKKNYFHVGIGAIYESETWKDFDGEIKQINLVKSSNYMGAVINLNEQIRLDVTGYYQVGYSKQFDQFLSRVSADLDFEIKINKKLNYVTSFQVQYEARPIIPISKFIYSLTNGLNFKFG